MSSASESQLAELMLQAEALPPAERIAFLKRQCANSELLAVALGQLASTGDEEWWHRVDASDDASNAVSHFDLDWSRADFGPYRAIRPLGHGGMGEVLLAERSDDQFKQRVAIKLVKRGVLSRQARVRLKSERQILANLNHPNIARLLDGGATTDGTPYIVMEYVDGEPIDTYCDRNRLTIAQRLRVFQVVCAAVHRAHQNLVVHRDLKPSNILVTSEGVPKLLDFGIAKLLDERVSMHTVAVTQESSRMMTPDHASPEQIQGLPLTTASDVYALGVLLYELLAGHRPYKLETMRFVDIERVVCEEPVTPPSVHFTRAAQTESGELEKLADRRAISVGKLARELRGDLGNIVLMAMRKEPERRYESAERLAADIGRFLAGLPVVARADTWNYRLGKFVGRHKFGVAASVVGFVALMAFTTTTIVQGARIAKERERAEEVSTFLVDLFDLADPEHNRGNEVTIREALDIGSRRIATKLDTQPDTRATLLTTIGSVYASLGLYDDAARLLRESLDIRIRVFGSEHPTVADSTLKLGGVLVQSRDLAGAEPLLIKSLALNKKLYGPHSLPVAESLHGLAKLKQIQERFDESGALFAESLSMFDNLSPPAEAQYASVLSDLGTLQLYQGNFKIAEDSYRKALMYAERSLGNDHPAVPQIMNDLALTLRSQGRLAEAQPLFEGALERLRAVYGPKHPTTIVALSNYAMFLRLNKELDKAEAALREAVALEESLRGPRNYNVGYNRAALGRVLYEKMRYDDAEQEFRAALDIYREALPKNHLYVVAAKHWLGRTLLSFGRNKEAETELTEALKIARALLPDDNLQIAVVRGALGHAIAMQSRYSEAAPLLLTSYAIVLRAQGPSDPNGVAMHGWIEDLYKRWGKPGEAANYFASLSSDSTPKAP